MYRYADEAVGALMGRLLREAGEAVCREYAVSDVKVSPAMVSGAQEIVDGLSRLLDAGAPSSELNRSLLELFHLIPRKMARVADHLFPAETAAGEGAEAARQIVWKEQETLDLLRTQVELLRAGEARGPEPRDLLAEMGVSLETVPPDGPEFAEVRALMGDHAPMLRAVFRAQNHATQAAFDARAPELSTAGGPRPGVHLFWHGSRNENWVSILKSGLSLRPASAVITGKMFGHGLYFAKKFAKSLGYSSLRGSHWAKGGADRGFLALYSVYTGSQLAVDEHQRWCLHLTEEKLKARGDYDSLWAKAGKSLRNDEFVVYNEAQTTITYLVEVGEAP